MAREGEEVAQSGAATSPLVSETHSEVEEQEITNSRQQSSQDLVRSSWPVGDQEEKRDQGASGDPTSTGANAGSVSNMSTHEDVEQTLENDGGSRPTELSLEGQKGESQEIRKSTLTFAAISPGLSNIRLPLSRALVDRGDVGTEDEAKKAAHPRVEPKIGDLVKSIFGKGQVLAVREDGMLEVIAVGWEMSGEQRPRHFVRKESVEVIPTVYYQMSLLERLQMAAWLKGEGTKLFKEGNFTGAAEKYMKSIGVLKTCNFETNAQNARALETMIPCHNNAATCYIKLKDYKDARRLAESVDTLCSILERNVDGAVMAQLNKRGVSFKQISQWWCLGLLRGGSCCLLLGDYEDSVTLFKKAAKLANKIDVSATMRKEIRTGLEKATKRYTSQRQKAQKMWTKAFNKNSTEPAPDHDERHLSAGTRAPNDLLEKLEALAKVNGQTGVSNEILKGVSTRTTPEQGEEDEDDDAEESLLTTGLLWGTIAVGVIALSVATRWALGKRRTGS